MAETQVFFYRDDDGTVPVSDCLAELRYRDRKAFTKCVAAIRGLEAFGHELRRPNSDYLEQGIYELRVRKGRVNYRILYFFHGRNVALLAHALTKERKVPSADLKRAVQRKKRYEIAPEVHTAEEDLNDG